jgi:methylmalonyl-CoA mutase C-terminal domain/subunit|tara:strand:- start:152 stop:559 length:408 start_codon:yes stop_codon:yes gene_type:complete
MADAPIKVLITKLGLDTHDRGAMVVAHALRQAGMEVVLLDTFQTPEAIVDAAAQEDVDVIGVSCLSGEHLRLTPRLMQAIADGGLDDRLVIYGGIFPREDIAVLKDMGVDNVFIGSLSGEFVAYIEQNYTAKRRA